MKTICIKILKKLIMKNNAIKRVQAFALDLFLVILAIIACGVILMIAGISYESFPFVMMAVMYVVFCSKDMMHGQSVGKRVYKIQIVDMVTGQKVGFVRCFLRNLPILIWPIEMLMIMSGKDRRFGDYLVGTKLEYYE